MATAAPHTTAASKSGGPKRNNAARIFGYDIFISFALGPPPRGTHSYASDLARRLRERDFSVFFSEDEASPGDQLDSTLLKALRRSRILVVIANRGTLEDPRWVRTEVGEFRSRHPGRPIIPISVGGALQDAILAKQTRQWLAFQDKIWLDEPQDAVAQGIASEELVRRLAMALTGRSSNAKWRWIVRAVIAGLIVLAATAAIAAVLAVKARDSAQVNEKKATQNEQLAKTNEALAKSNEQRALKGEAEARNEAALALARQLAAQSAGAFQRHDLPQSEALAIESLKVKDTLEGRKSLEEVLNLLLPVPQLTRMDSKEAIQSLAFSRDNKWMAWGGCLGTIGIWDTTSHKTKQIFRNLGSHVLALAFSDVDDWLGVLTDEALWLIARDSRPPQRLWNEGPSSVANVHSVAFSPDGQYLAAADGTQLQLFQRISAIWVQIKVSANRDLPAANSVVFLSNSTLGIAGTHGVSFMDVPSLSLNTDVSSQKECDSISLSLDRHLLVAGCRGEILAAEISDQNPRIPIQFSSIPVTGFIANQVAINNDGSYIAAKNLYTGAIYVLDASSSTATIRETTLPLISMGQIFAFRPQDQRLVAGLENGAVAAWSLNHGALASLWPPEFRATGINRSPDSKWLAVTCADRRIRILRASDVENPQPVHQFQTGENLRNPIFSPDSRFLAVVDDDKAYLFDTGSWRLLHRFNASPTTRASFSSDSETFFLFDPLEFRRFKTSTFKPILPTISQKFAKGLIVGEQDFKFSSDGNLLAVVSKVRRAGDQVYGNVTRIWDLNAGSQVGWIKTKPHDALDPEADLGGRQSLIVEAAGWHSVFSKKPTSPDGKWLFDFSTSSPTESLTESKSGQNLLELDHDAPVIDAAFSPDSRWLFTASENQPVRVWPLDVKTTVDQACKLLAANPTKDTWQELHIPGDYHKICQNLP